MAEYVGKKRAMSLVNQGALVADMRSPVDFRDGSVEGAENLPLRKFLNRITGLDRKTKILMFGLTAKDDDIQHAINYAEQMGFKKLFVTSYGTLLEGEKQRA